MDVIVVVGGGPLGGRAVAGVPPAAGAIVIAADSGLDAAVAAGLRPTTLVGDLDSISAAGRAWAADHGVTVEAFPTDKNATDTELAVAAAARSGATHLTLLGGGGDRLDHLLGTLGALGGEHTAGFATVAAWLGGTRIHVARAHQPVAADLAAGTTFSVVALHGPCTGVSISGARWPLHDACLAAGSTHGISNLSTQLVTVTVASGTLTMVIP